MIDLINEHAEGAVLLTGFDDCIVGITEEFGNGNRILYSKEKIIIKEGESVDSPINGYSFNISNQKEATKIIDDTTKVVNKPNNPLNAPPNPLNAAAPLNVSPLNAAPLNPAPNPLNPPPLNNTQKLEQNKYQPPPMEYFNR